MKKITDRHILLFTDHLIDAEKSRATVEQYTRYAQKFMEFTGGRKVTKELTMEYKQFLLGKDYAPATINNMLTIANLFLEFIGEANCTVKLLVIQEDVYASEDTELTQEEYERLLEAAKGDPLFRLIMMTLAGTGIRVSELAHFTVEGVRGGVITVNNKGKLRKIIIPPTLQRRLLDFCQVSGIKNGRIFISRKGNPLDRSYIWKKLKKYARAAKVELKKVFPHNFRKLFARTFNDKHNNMACLANILGHSNINTTRIYVRSTEKSYRNMMEGLGLVV